MMRHFFMAAIAALTLAVGLAQPAEAKKSKQPPQEKTHRIIRDVTPLYASIEQFSAKKRSPRRHYARRGGGACDGFQRCRCGTTTARRHGLPYAYNGLNLKKASEWYSFPRTSFGVGAVGVAPHHVLTVEGGSDCRSATVYDDAGTYQRNVCGMTFVAVSGGGFAAPQQTANVRHNRTASAKPDYPVYADNSRCNDGGLCAVVGDGPYRGKYKSMKHRKPAMEMQQYAANTY